MTINPTELRADVPVPFDPPDDLPAVGELLTVVEEVHQLLAGLIDLVPEHVRAADELDRDTLLIVQDNLQRSWAHAITAARYMREAAPRVDGQ